MLEALIATASERSQQTPETCAAIHAVIGQVAPSVAAQPEAPAVPAPPGPQPHWGEHLLSENERNAIDALVYYQATERHLSARDIEIAVERAFNVAEMSQLKAW